MFNSLKKHRNQKGFTLIELMIVVAIIGILAAIAIPQFATFREKGYIASMKADCNSIRTAEEAYYVDNNSYKELGATGAIDDPSALLPGTSPLSDGNEVVVALVSTTGYTITVTSTKLSSGSAIQKVIYDSATGQLETSS